MQDGYSNLSIPDLDVYSEEIVENDDYSMEDIELYAGDIAEAIEEGKVEYGLIAGIMPYVHFKEDNVTFYIDNDNIVMEKK